MTDPEIKSWSKLPSMAVQFFQVTPRRSAMLMYAFTGVRGITLEPNKQRTGKTALTNAMIAAKYLNSEWQTWAEIRAKSNLTKKQMFNAGRVLIWMSIVEGRHAPKVMGNLKQYKLTEYGVNYLKGRV